MGISSLNLFSLNNINDKQHKLGESLATAASSPALDYHSICKMSEQGLYIIFDKSQILYIGKTTRTGKIRMQELAADFRSHTFNRKLLGERFRELGFVFTVLHNKTKKEWIDKDIITESAFREQQQVINTFIRESLHFKFLSVTDSNWLTLLEHFAIAVLNPKHND
ncbi:MAG TPA: hypothetical protein VGE25_06710 [Sediminibacterium sp.]